MRVLVTGSRDLTDQDLVFDTLSGIYQEAEPGEQFVVIHGGARGADSFAGQWARSVRRYGVREEEHAADWKAHGRAAGPIRNKAMIDSRPDLCVAFFKEGAGNVGTQNCVTQATLAKVPVQMYYQA